MDKTKNKRLLWLAIKEVSLLIQIYKKITKI